METKLKRIFAVSIILALCFASLAIKANASQVLTITLFTDKPAYWLGDTVTLFGYLDVNQTRISNGLVALQIQNPLNYSILFRTLPTGLAPIYNQTVKMQSVFLCDNFGKPKSKYVSQFPNLAYFNVTMQNTNKTAIDFYLTLTVLDSAQGIVGSTYQRFTSVLPNATIKTVTSLSMPPAIPTGNATLYVNTFTQFPEYGGYPLSIENSTLFLVTNPAGSANKTQTHTSTQTNGQFATTFNMPLYLAPGIGNYPIYTSSKYVKLTATTQTSVQFKVPDLNGDRKVNVLDLIIIANWLGWTGPPGGIPEDLNQDGKVNILDLLICVRFLGWPPS